MTFIKNNRLHSFFHIQIGHFINNHSRNFLILSQMVLSYLSLSHLFKAFEIIRKKTKQIIKETGDFVNSSNHILSQSQYQFE